MESCFGIVIYGAGLLVDDTDEQSLRLDAGCRLLGKTREVISPFILGTDKVWNNHAKELMVLQLLPMAFNEAS